MAVIYSDSREMKFGYSRLQAYNSISISLLPGPFGPLPIKVITLSWNRFHCSGTKMIPTQQGVGIRFCWRPKDPNSTRCVGIMFYWRPKDPNSTRCRHHVLLEAQGSQLNKVSASGSIGGPRIQTMFNNNNKKTMTRHSLQLTTQNLRSMPSTQNKAKLTISQRCDIKYCNIKNNQ
ncbi:unnamed protein product [Lymnaea stagnalis]|uniref:Uncharacterized protein n=1 Tax=Lymnaea stagnalis TaxID=6523 RepID=A0AAV2HF74_LYMST